LIRVREARSGAPILAGIEFAGIVSQVGPDVRGVRELALVARAEKDVDSSNTLWIEPRLTSIQVHAAEMGARAAAMLLGRLDGTLPDDRVADLGFEIVERAST
jgi:NADPH:quinone reductase-like Zn-dependent oxidoreductase